MNGPLNFTDKDRQELTYLLFNSNICISSLNKKIVPMGGYWYPYENDKDAGRGFEKFHDAVVWLMNPFWEEATGHPYR